MLYRLMLIYATLTEFLDGRHSLPYKLQLN